MTNNKQFLKKTSPGLGTELEEIFKYFSLSEEEKAKNFESIVNESIQLSEKIKDKLLNGTDEEKEDMQNLLVGMAEKVQEETSRICNEIGISKEEILAIADNPDNFSKEDWEVLQEAKEYIKEAQGQNVSSLEKVEKKKSKKKGKRVPITEWVHS